MPSIEILKKYASKPSLRKWEETRVYLAGCGARAVFSNPVEFRMGAYSWGLELFDGGLKKRISKSGLLCPATYQPWSHDSSCLFLISWKDGAYLYEVGSGSTRQCELSGLVVDAIGSRRFPGFLAITDKGEYFIAKDGTVGRALTIRRPVHGYPFLNWFDKAGQFFAVENQGPGLASLRFFGAETGDLSAAVPFHPNSQFPYDEAKYDKLKRDSYALVLSDATQCVGSLLDEWSSITFEENTDLLKMMVYRPVGEIYEKRALQVCKVEENWVEVRLQP